MSTQACIQVIERVSRSYRTELELDAHDERTHCQHLRDTPYHKIRDKDAHAIPSQEENTNRYISHVTSPCRRRIWVWAEIDVFEDQPQSTTETFTTIFGHKSML
jgi:hypothetical protein